MTLRLGRHSIRLSHLLAVVTGVVLVVAAIADTRFLDPVSSAAHQPEQFDPPAYAQEQFPVISAEIVATATDLTVLAAAIKDDPAAAGAEYGNDLGANQYAFPVWATGTVTEVDDEFIYLEVPGMPDGSDVRIPRNTSLSGIPVRDATGMIGFGDFNTQTDFQSVANEFKLLMQQEVLAPADPPSLADQVVNVIGGYSSGGPADLYLIHPVQIEVAP